MIYRINQMAKRKAAQIEEPVAGSTPRRSSRRISSNTATQDSGKGEPKAATPSTKQTKQKGAPKAKSAKAKEDAIEVEVCTHSSFLRDIWKWYRIRC